MSNKNKNILDGFVPRRSARNGSDYNAPLTGAPAQLNRQSPLAGPTNRKQKRQLARAQRKSSDTSWQSKALKNSVLNSANPSDPLSKDPSELADGGDGKKRRRRQKQIGPRSKWQKIRRVLKYLLIPLLLIGGFYVFNFLNLSGKVFDGNPLGFLKSTKLKGEDSGRVNILLAGTSEGDPNHPGEDLTDSIMVISYTVATKKTAIISIPRDFWVKNSYAATKINALYHYGESAEFDEEGFYKGGIGLLQKEVEKITGLDINYYAKINYNAFKEAVDAVGGIEVDIQGSDSRGIYDPNFDGQYGKNALKLPNGVQKLTGTQALLLARARNANGGYGLAGSDYDRAENQRKMLIALKDKALGANIFANPLKLNQLTDAIGDNIVTDFNTSEARRIYDLAGDPTTQIKSVGLTSENVLKNYSSAGTGAALIPKSGIGDYTAIKAFIQEKIGPLQAPTSSTTTNSQSPAETSKVVVLNAGGASGSAKQVATLLPATSTALEVGNSTEKVSGTNLVVLNSVKQSSKQLLLSKLAAKEYTSPKANYSSLYPNADFVILVGKSTN
jgi:LCP family protein required for cell wall assembly